jgi:hypothetical protein
LDSIPFRFWAASSGDSVPSAALATFSAKDSLPNFAKFLGFNLLFITFFIVFFEPFWQGLAFILFIAEALDFMAFITLGGMAHYKVLFCQENNPFVKSYTCGKQLPK